MASRSQTRDGRRYAFTFGDDPDIQPFSYGCSYTLPNGPLSQETHSVAGLSLLQAVLGLSGPPEPLALFARPGADAMVTVRKVVDPVTLDAPITDLQLSVTVDFVRRTSNHVRLRVASEEGGLVGVSQADITGRGDGRGSFTRTYTRGNQLTLTAQPVYGSLQFERWVDAVGRVLGTAPTLSLGMTSDRDVRAIYRRAQNDPPPSPPSPSDTDGDQLPDAWEARFGLSASNATGSDGAVGDPDGDGVNNAQELAAGTHPRGFYRRYLAEGALNQFFDVWLALVNAGADTAHLQLRLLQSDGTVVTMVEDLAPRTRRTIGRDELSARLTSADFATVAESDQPIALDRTMTWDASGYGSHAETAVESASTTWYLAEGSTSGDFSLFYLLENPAGTPATATVRFLRPFGQAPIEQSYTLPANSRTTIPVDDVDARLANTDVSAAIAASAPIIVERAMYKGAGFAAGHESAGVTEPSTRWFLAEGATGPFFDLFILLANPSGRAADVRVDYLLSTGATYSKQYTVPAEGRFTIWVDDEVIPNGSGQRPLDNVAVSTTVTSLNDTPIIVERSMWWPGPGLAADFWTEAHNSPGVTKTGRRWALAEGEVGGPSTRRRTS
jgi:hypothetical protein